MDSTAIRHHNDAAAYAPDKNAGAWASVVIAGQQGRTPPRPIQLHLPAGALKARQLSEQKCAQVLPSYHTVAEVVWPNGHH
jgi:hypothetical protein